MVIELPKYMLIRSNIAELVTYDLYAFDIQHLRYDLYMHVLFNSMSEPRLTEESYRKMRDDYYHCNRF